MSVVLELKPELEKKLRQKADANGSLLSAYVATVLEEHVDSGPTLDEILAPVRKQFDDSGMTEDELDEFMNEIREEAYQERRASREL